MARFLHFSMALYSVVIYFHFNLKYLSPVKPFNLNSVINNPTNNNSKIGMLYKTSLICSMKEFNINRQVAKIIINNAKNCLNVMPQTFAGSVAKF